jgi:hypothetical protein
MSEMPIDLTTTHVPLDFSFVAVPEYTDGSTILRGNPLAVSAKGGVSVGGRGAVIVTQSQHSPSLIEDPGPGGDYSATWNQFTNDPLRFYPEGHPEWTLLRLTGTSLTIAVGQGGTRLVNLVWNRFTNFNWYTVRNDETGDPDGMVVQVRLMNSVGGDLIPPASFNWRQLCLPCYDHQAVRPFNFPDFPQFYRDVKRVEIAYMRSWWLHCDSNPCQPKDEP